MPESAGARQVSSTSGEAIHPPPRAPRFLRWVGPFRIKPGGGYFTFHRALEQEHEDSMEQALRESSELAVDSLRYGIDTMLNYLQRMWMGLEKRWQARRGHRDFQLTETHPTPKNIV